MYAKILGIGLVMVGSVLASESLAIAKEECINDIDCTAHGTACGTDICSWTSTPHRCVPASSGRTNGWCTTSADCKCAAQGAACVSSYCTFTLPPAGVAATAAGSADRATSPSSSSCSRCAVSAQSPTGSAGLPVLGFGGLAIATFLRRRRSRRLTPRGAAHPDRCWESSSRGASCTAPRARRISSGRRRARRSDLYS